VSESDSPNLRPTVLRVDLDALSLNATALKTAGGGRPLLAVVKANGYGCGAAHVARAALRGGASWLGVALAEEGIQLRERGIVAPILLLGPVPPTQAGLLLDHGLTPALYSLSFLQALEEAAERTGRSAEVHLKLDSGMGRVGFRPEEIPDLLGALRRSPRVSVAGIFSNLASADDPRSDQTAHQVRAFQDMVETLRRAGMEPAWVHLANSSGLLAHPDTHLTLCRPGLTLFGLRPSADLPDPGLRPVLSFSTRIAQIKRVPPGTPVGYGATYVTSSSKRLGILPVGYGDGLPRALGNVGHVLIEGAACPIVGRVSMDLVAVDLDPAPGAVEGGPVCLWGSEGTLNASPWDWARWSGTIPYEVMTGISCRVARRYAEGGREWTEFLLNSGGPLA